MVMVMMMMMMIDDLASVLPDTSTYATESRKLRLGDQQGAPPGCTSRSRRAQGECGKGAAWASPKAHVLFYSETEVCAARKILALGKSCILQVFRAEASEYGKKQTNHCHANILPTSPLHDVKPGNDSGRGRLKDSGEICQASCTVLHCCILAY